MFRNCVGCDVRMVIPQLLNVALSGMRHSGFRLLASNPSRMFMTMKQVRAIIDVRGKADEDRIKSELGDGTS